MEKGREARSRGAFAQYHRMDIARRGYHYGSDERRVDTVEGWDGGRGWIG